MSMDRSTTAQVLCAWQAAAPGTTQIVPCRAAASTPDIVRPALAQCTERTCRHESLLIRIGSFSSSSLLSWLISASRWDRYSQQRCPFADMPHGLQLGLQLAPLRERIRQNTISTTVAHIAQPEEALHQDGARQPQNKLHNPVSLPTLTHYYCTLNKRT
jgi:hypothetical protein